MNYIIIRNEINKVIGYAYSDDGLVVEGYSIQVSEEVFNDVLSKLEFLTSMEGYELILNDDLAYKVLDNMSGLIEEYVW